MRRFLRPGLLIGVVLLPSALLSAIVAPLAWAHGDAIPTVAAHTLAESVDRPAPVPDAADASVPIGSDAWPALLLLGALAVGLWAPRRVRVALLVALLGVLAFESGVHAVHHLGDVRAAARCAVASAAPHLGSADVSPATYAPALQASDGRVAALESLALPARSLGPTQGRAPPPTAS